MSAANRAHLDLMLQDIFKRADEVIDEPEIRSLAAEQQKRELNLIQANKDMTQ